MCNRGRGEGLGCVESIYSINIVQELYTVYLTRFRTYKSALPPQTKTYEGRGPQTDKHLPPSTFIWLIFNKCRHLGFGVFIDIWSMVCTGYVYLCDPGSHPHTLYRHRRSHPHRHKRYAKIIIKNSAIKRPIYLTGSKN